MKNTLSDKFVYYPNIICKYCSPWSPNPKPIKVKAKISFPNEVGAYDIYDNLYLGTVVDTKYLFKYNTPTLKMRELAGIKYGGK